MARTRDVGAALAFETVFLISISIIFPLTVRNLGPVAYGEYTTMYVVAGLAIVWVYAGVGSAVLQLWLQLRRSSRSLHATAVRHVLVSALPVGAVGLVIIMAIFGAHLLLAAVLVFGTDLVIAGLTQINVSLVYSIRGVPAATRLRIIAPILKTVGVLVLAGFGAITLLALVICNLVSSVVVLVVSARAARRARAADDPERTATTSGEMFRYSTYYSTAMSTNAVQEEGDKIVLAAVRPANEVGEYFAAYRIVSMSLLPLRAVNAAATRWFLPVDERRGSHVRKTALLSIPSAVFGVACAVGVIVGRPVIAWVVGDEFANADTVALWLCLLPLLHGLAELPNLGLLGLGQNRARVILGVVTATAATCCYVVLIPRIGWRGAVIGTYVSEGLTVVVGWFLLLKLQRRQDRRLDQDSAVDGGDEAANTRASPS